MCGLKDIAELLEGVPWTSQVFLLIKTLYLIIRYGMVSEWCILVCGMKERGGGGGGRAVDLPRPRHSLRSPKTPTLCRCARVAILTLRQCKHTSVNVADTGACSALFFKPPTLQDAAHTPSFIGNGGHISFTTAKKMWSIW